MNLEAATQSSKLYTEYDDFAWFYNRYWSKRLVDQIFWTVDEYLLKRLKPGDHILDVCCGNGHLAALMSGRGFMVTGIDGSEAMLQFARENSPSSRFHVADARSFTFDCPFQAAVSTCDSLNHVMTIEELTQVFANVYAVLRPGGYFLFDLNTEEGYKKYWNGQSGGRAEKECVYVVKLDYDAGAQQGTFAATMFRLAGNRWIRSDVLLKQQYYPTEMVLRSLEKVGFNDIQVYDVEADLGVSGTGRVMFVMRKTDPKPRS